MTNNKWTKTEDFLDSIEIPEYSNRYAPIKHNVFINEIKEGLDKQGLIITDKKYLIAQKGKIMCGEYMMDGGIKDMDMKVAISFQNSYNRQLSASCRSGALILLCSNGMYGLSGNTYKRKHLGTNALSDVKINITSSIINAKESFEKLVQDKEELKTREIDKKIVAQLLGDMYINEAIITSEQLNIIKHEIDFSKDFKEMNAWSMYNWCTEGLKHSHPSNYMKSHLQTHAYLSDKFELTNARGLYK